MSKLQLLLLGHFDCLLSSGQRISLSMRKAEVLLAYLALAPGIRHPRERLINLLWSDRGEEQARNSLRQCLSTIRKTLGDAGGLMLQIDRTTVTLNADLIDVDAHEFERLAASAEFESLSDAAALYRGEFLEGISIRDAACQEWLDSERARFKRQYIEILANLGRTLLASRDYSHAIKTAERLVEQDPLSESGWRMLMRAYHENGNRSHALQACKRCQKVLRDELGIDPEPATLQLREQIAAGETGSYTPTQQISPAVAALEKKSVETLAQAEQSVTGHNIAVLPFDNLSGDPEQEYFSDGISESIILHLNLFPGLIVKSRNSSFAFKQQIKSLGEVSKELGVDYIVEGSLRKSADQIRITAQLIEAASGNQVWGKRYDAPLTDLFSLEEELSRSIAATVTGQIDADLQRIALTRGAADQQAYDLLLSGIYHNQRFTREDTIISIEKLNQCLAKDPDNPRAHVNLYNCHLMDYLDRWSEDYLASFERAAEHVHKAIALAPESGLARTMLGQYLVFCGDFDEAARHLDKAFAINPNDPTTLATMALNLEIQGIGDEALELAQRACQLDPFHPWAEWEIAGSLFLMGEYEAIPQAIAKMRVSLGFIQIFEIAANVKLGRVDPARRRLQSLLQECRHSMLSMPQTLDDWLLYTRENYPFADPQINQDIVDCLVQAGLDDAIDESTGTVEPSEYPSILVLPFGNLSGDPEQEYFSDGISDSVIFNLSAFPGLRVKSRHASFAFKESARSLDDIAAELGVQYVVEGNIRKFGDKIRVTAQLSETASGHQVWGKRFDSDIDDLFALEEELSMTIAGTVNTRVDKAARLRALRKPAKDLQSYDYFMRGSYHLELFNADDIDIAIKLLEKCLALDADNSLAHAKLGIAHMVALYENCARDRKRSLELMDKHLRRALELDPDDAEAHAFMAERLMYKKDFDGALVHAQKAVEVNPTLADGYSMLAWHAGSVGQLEKARAYAEKSMRTDIHHPYAGWNAGEIYRLCGDYELAIQTFRSMAHISTSVYAQIAACLAGLNRIDEARAEMRHYLELAREQMTTLPSSREEWYAFWSETMPYKHREDTDRFFDLLMQAGLCDDADELGDDTPSIAVLPFKNLSGDNHQEYFSDGITSSLILGLGMFRGLRVKSQNSSFAYRDSDKSSTEIADELDVDFLIEGSMRKSGSKIRLTVQLVEAGSDTQIWGKQYDAEFDDILELEQKLSGAIAGTISGRIGHTLQKSASHKPAKSLRSYDYLLRGLYHFGKFTAHDLTIARDMIEKCLALDPDNAVAHSNLGTIHLVELMENWAPDRHQSDQSAAHHLKLAIELDPDNALAHAYLSEYLMIIRKDYEQSEFHADKAIECNPTASEGYAAKADLLGIIRRVDDALPYAEKALQLDPHSVGAGWAAGEVYRKAGLYQQAIKTFRSMAHPPASVHALIAACFLKMELIEEAHKEMEVYRQLAKQEMSSYPDSISQWQDFWRMNIPYRNDEDFEEFFTLLLQAGLVEQDSEAVEDSPSAVEDSPSIAVLPFENMSGDPEQAFFSDGITADIITTLSKFKHLRTIARHSTEIYRERKASIAEIAAEQDVRYILEGSVRKSGKRIRVSAELIDAQSEQNCWSERYDRDLDDLFAVQDEITQRITLAMKVHLDDGDKALTRSAGTASIEAWQLVMTAVDLQDTYILQNILDSRAMLQRATEIDPDYGYAWIFLGWTHWQEAYTGWSNSFEESMVKAQVAVDKALELEPDNGEAWALQGTLYIVQQKPEQVIPAIDKALRLEPGNAEIQTLAGFAYNFVGDYEKALQYFDNALRLSPICPNWYYLVGYQAEKGCGNPGRAIELLRQGVAVEVESPLVRFYLASALLDKGDRAGARAVADEIRRLDKHVTGSGVVRSYSQDEVERGRFLQNLESLGLA